MTPTDDEALRLNLIRAQADAERKRVRPVGGAFWRLLRAVAWGGLAGRLAAWLVDGVAGEQLPAWFRVYGGLVGAAIGVVVASLSYGADRKTV